MCWGLIAPKWLRGTLTLFLPAPRATKPEEHVQLIRMKRDRENGFHSERCQFEASILFVLSIGWVSVLRLRRGDASFLTSCAHRPACSTNTRCSDRIIEDFIVRWTRGWGGGATFRSLHEFRLFIFVHRPRRCPGPCVQPPSRGCNPRSGCSEAALRRSTSPHPSPPGPSRVIPVVTRDASARVTCDTRRIVRDGLLPLGSLCPLPLASQSRSNSPNDPQVEAWCIAKDSGDQALTDQMSEYYERKFRALKERVRHIGEQKREDLEVLANKVRDLKTARRDLLSHARATVQAHSARARDDIAQAFAAARIQDWLPPPPPCALAHVDPVGIQALEQCVQTLRAAVDQMQELVSEGDGDVLVLSELGEKDPVWRQQMVLRKLGTVLDGVGKQMELRMAQVREQAAMDHAMFRAQQELELGLTWCALLPSPGPSPPPPSQRPRCRRVIASPDFSADPSHGPKEGRDR